MNVPLSSSYHHPYFLQAGLTGVCVYVCGRERSLGTAPTVQRSGTLVSAAGWPVSQTKGRPLFLRVIKPGGQGIHWVSGLVLVSKKTFLPWGLGSEVGAGRYVDFQIPVEHCASWIAKWWVNASNTGKDRLRWLVPRSVCYFSTDLFLISLHLRFLIWQLVSLFLMGKAWSPLFLEELWAVGLSLAALSRARLISMQPLWPQITQHSLDWKEKQQLWGTLWKSTEDFAKGRRKSPRWQKEIIARNCSGASGHLAYNFWSAQHRFKPLKAVLPGFCFIRV